jgi:hypothetical protein
MQDKKKLVSHWLSCLNRSARPSAINYQPTGYGTFHIVLQTSLWLFASASWQTLASSSSSGPDNLDNLKKLAEIFQRQVPGAEAAAQDDDDVPELVQGETFEEAAEKEPQLEQDEKKES